MRVLSSARDEYKKEILLWSTATGYNGIFIDDVGVENSARICLTNIKEKKSECSNADNK